MPNNPTEDRYMTEDEYYGTGQADLWDSPEDLIADLNQLSQYEEQKYFEQNFYLDTLFTDATVEKQKPIDSDAIAKQHTSWSDAMIPIVGVDNITGLQELYNKATIGVFDFSSFIAFSIELINFSNLF